MYAQSALAQQVGHPLRHSASMPLPTWKRDGTSAPKGTPLPPTNDGGLVSPYGMPTHARVRKQPKWEQDKRCDPTARFFKTPNLDHLMYTEEV